MNDNFNEEIFNKIVEYFRLGNSEELSEIVKYANPITRKKAEDHLGIKFIWDGKKFSYLSWAGKGDKNL